MEQKHTELGKKGFLPEQRTQKKGAKKTNGAEKKVDRTGPQRFQLKELLMGRGVCVKLGVEST